MAELATFQSISRDIRANRPAPVYLLHGEEGYYIDALTELFQSLVPEADRDFDLSVLYAPDLDSPKAVIAAAKRYSMFGSRQVVIVKEIQSVAQRADFLNSLASYAAAPTESTVLVLCFRGMQATGAAFMKALKAGGGVVFESKKLNERSLGTEVTSLLKERNLSVDPKALTMICDYVGTDLSRLYNEIGKLAVTLPPGAMVTPEVIERNIGISKDYNNFELISAIASANAAKTMEIYSHFRANPKGNPVQVIEVVLFNFFSNLLAAFYTPDRSDHSLMQALGFRSPYQLKDIKEGMKHYGPWEAIEIIGKIRRFDAASKGNGSRLDPFDLLFDLLMNILNPMGQKGIKL